MTKISQLTSIGDSLAIDDQFLIRDVSDGTTPNKSVTVSGIARALADGSATVPALAFAADKNTGLYRVGADQLSFSTNGTERLRIDSNGQIEAVSLGSAASPVFSYVGDPNTGTFSPGADTWAVSTNGTERARIDSSGRLLVGTSAARSNFYNSTGAPRVQVESTTSDGGSLSLTTNFTTATPSAAPNLLLARSGATTLGSNTLVAADNTLGNINFLGSDGSEFVSAAQITAFVDGTPGADDMPGRLVFSTAADGSATPSPRMTIKADGSVGVGTQTPATRLDINTSTAQTALTLRATTDTTSVLKLGVGGGVSTNIPSIKANTALEIGTEADQPLVFYTGVSVTERLRIAANGLHTINSSAHSGAALSTTAPAKLYISTGTYTDTSTAASGTVAHGTIVAFDNPAINSTNATVAYTNASTVYIDGAPTGTGNVTVTNGFALYVNAGRCHFGGSVLSASPTDGVGYKTGAGGTVTQATSRTTGVTINKICGSITLVSAAGSTSYQSFTVTNSTVAATDTVIVNQQSGTDLYDVFVTAVAAGSFRITFATTGGTTTEQPVFNFSVLKAVAT